MTGGSPHRQESTRHTFIARASVAYDDRGSPSILGAEMLHSSDDLFRLYIENAPRWVGSVSGKLSIEGGVLEVVKILDALIGADAENLANPGKPLTPRNTA